jgi:hypothetical protein
VEAALAAAGVRAIGAGLAGRGDIGLNAQDGLDALGLAGLVERDGAEDVAVVGDGDGLHPQFGDAGHELVDLVAAIEQRELAVEMEVDEGPDVRGPLSVALYRRVTHPAEPPSVEKHHRPKPTLSRESRH